MRPMKVAIAASLPLIAVSAILPGAGASAAPNFLAAPTYSSTLLGAGQASMYPVDVTQNTKYYFVLDAGNYRVVAVNRTSGAIDCQIGGLQGNGPGQFGDARALDYDTATNQLFVADTPNNRVEIFSFAATKCAAHSATAFTFVSQFGTKGTGNEQFAQVYGIAVDAVNNWVYAVDGAGRVEKSTPAGTFISSFGTGILNQPRQVTVAPNSDVLVMNARNHECDVFNSAGTLLFAFGKSRHRQRPVHRRSARRQRQSERQDRIRHGLRRQAHRGVHHDLDRQRLQQREVQIHDLVGNRRRSVRRPSWPDNHVKQHARPHG